MPQIVVLCLVEHAKYSYSTVVYIPFSAEGKLAHLLFSSAQRYNNYNYLLSTGQKKSLQTLFKMLPIQLFFLKLVVLHCRC